MATIGAQLLSKIIRTGALMSVVDYGITTDDFPITHEKVMYDMLLEEYRATRAQGGQIGPMLAKHKFPTFDLCDDEFTTIQQLCYELRKQRLVREGKEVGERLIKTIAAGTDPLVAIAAAQQRAVYLQGLGNSQDVNMSIERGMDLVLQDYALAEGGQLTGILRTPWEPLTAATGGYQKDDFHIYYGRPKSMKSFVLAYQIAHAYLEKKRVLVYTKEMTPVNITRRIGGCIGELPYHELRRGLLTRQDKDRLNETHAYIRTQRELTDGKQSLDILSGLDVNPGEDTVEWLFAQIEKYKPDVVFVDGFYLLSCSKSYSKENERLKHNSRLARQYQLRMQIPIIVTVQANRGAEGNTRGSTGDIAGTDAYGTDATIITRVINEVVTPTIMLVFSGTREFRMSGMRIHAEPCTNFGFMEEIDDKAIAAATRADDAFLEEAKPVKRRKAKATHPVENVTDQLLIPRRSHLTLIPGGSPGTDPSDAGPNLPNGTQGCWGWF